MKVFESKQLGPWVGSEVRKELTGRIPATAIAGGEGRVDREQEEDGAHLLEGSRGRIAGRRVLIAGGWSTAAEVDGDGGTPVKDWQRGGVGELCGVMAKLARGWRGSGRAWSGGFTAAGLVGVKEWGRRRGMPELGMDGAIYSPKGGVSMRRHS